MHMQNRNEPKCKKIKTSPRKMNASVLVFAWNTEFLHNFFLFAKFKFRKLIVKFILV